MSKRKLLSATGAAWDVFIGMEVHAQLQLATKLFSAAPSYSTDKSDSCTPNEAVAWFDGAFPGTLPVLNKVAVEQAVRASIALGCQVNRVSVFERKHYFYGDLPHGYQITQQRLPIASNGALSLDDSDSAQFQPKDSSSDDTGEVPLVRVNRVQLEVDSGKSALDPSGGMNLVNLNRAGASLIEIVFEPDLRWHTEVGQLMKHLHLLLRHAGICDGNMEDGSMRCDLNISVRPSADEAGVLGQRVELKNLNSIKAMMGAAEAEALRQVAELEAGRCIEMETRGWDATKRCTYSLRTKEGQVDYRFFPEPDLPPLVLEGTEIERIRDSLPEMPRETLIRLQHEFGLSPYYAEVLVLGGASHYFEEVALNRDPVLAANWICNTLFALLRTGDGRSIGVDEGRNPVTAARLGGLLDLLAAKDISTQVAKDVLRIMFEEDLESSARNIVTKRDLGRVSDLEGVEHLCRAVVEDPEMAQPLEAYRSGKTRLVKLFVGKAMKACKGKADGKVITQVMEKLLQSHK
ncbi:unnamed protein product [Chrysoparadoxa australica]